VRWQCAAAKPPFVTRGHGSAMLRCLALLAAVNGAAGAAVELTPDNWDKEIAQSGKAAFIKFLAPW